MSKFEYAVNDQVVFRLDGDFWGGRIVGIQEGRDACYIVVPSGRTISWGVRAAEVLGKLRGEMADAADTDALRARIAEMEKELRDARNPVVSADVMQPEPVLYGLWLGQHREWMRDIAGLGIFKTTHKGLAFAERRLHLEMNPAVKIIGSDGKPMDLPGSEGHE